jgi:uncharacterized phage protein gp47/JayE
MGKMALHRGFKKKNFNEIKGDIERSLIASLGSINLMPPSVFATIIAIFAEREAVIWEQVESVYNASYPNTAEGQSLDGICALNGVIREVDTYSTALCQLTAINYTKIPKSSNVAVKYSDNLFQLPEDIIINNEKCCSLKLQIKPSLKKEYEININEQILKYTRLDGDTTESIAFNIAALLNKSHIKPSVTSPDESRLKILSVSDGDTLKISTVNHLIDFSCFASDGLKILEVTNNAFLIATKKGSIAAPIGSLVDIHTPVSGWLSANNLNAAKIGNNLESDVDLRYRRKESVKLGGSGTVEAIRANLLNLKGVTAVTITENTSDRMVDFIPPHSFRALVTGGDDLQIAQTIWQKKPAGIKSDGDLAVATTDSSGLEQVVKFSRPTKHFIYAKIIVTRTVHFNEDCIPTMRRRIVDQINRSGVGANVILKALFLSIFSEKDIANAVINLGGTTRTSYKPKLKEADVEIKGSEVSITDLSKIEIILEDF